MTFPKSILSIISKNSQKTKSSRREVFYRKGVLTNFTKFIGKHLCQSLFFNKVAGLRPVFSVNFVKFLRTPLFTEHLWATASETRKKQPVKEGGLRSMKISKNTSLCFILNLFSMGTKKPPFPYQFFPCNFSKSRN